MVWITSFIPLFSAMAVVGTNSYLEISDFGLWRIPPCFGFQNIFLSILRHFKFLFEIKTKIFKISYSLVLLQPYIYKYVFYCCSCIVCNKRIDSNSDCVT